MPAFSKSELIERLQGDLRGEHAAIIQYLQHAYRIGEGELACDIEEIAREEMRHYKWGSELVVYLGGDPTIERGLIAVDGSAAADLLYLDVHAERAAIARYEYEIQQIDDPRVRRVLERIVSDEKAHLQFFEENVKLLGGPSPKAEAFAAAKPYAEGSFAAETNMQVERMEPYPKSPGTPEAKVAVDLLNEDSRQQYSAILRYLHLAFVTGLCDVHKEMLENSAIDEMKHLGWLAEVVAELSGEPTTEHAGVNLSNDAATVLRSSIEDEREAIARYGRHLEAVALPEVKDLLARVRFQESYHEGSFTLLLEQLAAESSRAGTEGRLGRPRPGQLTVGSLRELKGTETESE